MVVRVNVYLRRRCNHSRTFRHHHHHHRHGRHGDGRHGDCWCWWLDPRRTMIDDTALQATLTLTNLLLTCLLTFLLTYSVDWLANVRRLWSYGLMAECVYYNCYYYCLRQEGYVSNLTQNATPGRARSNDLAGRSTTLAPPCLALVHPGDLAGGFSDLEIYNWFNSGDHPRLDRDPGIFGAFFYIAR